MVAFYDILVARGECPPDCLLCEETCATAQGDGRVRISNLSLPEVGFFGVVKCNQCSEPACAEVCPTRAITKSDRDGVVRIDEERCVGCGLCSLACPYGGIHYSAQDGKAVKCDNCNGEPKCVEVCKYDVLSFTSSRSVLDYVGEDAWNRGSVLCPGCGEELAIRFALRALGQNITLFSCAGCSATALGSTSRVITTAAPVLLCLMTNVPSCMTGAKRYYDRIGREVTCVCLVGDGATADVGFQPLSGAAERNEKILYICLDNEAYMNTGIQRSGTTPYLSWTTTTPLGERSSGKKQEAKNVPLLMAFHRISYVATATVAFLEDYVQKLLRAKAATSQGMAYIHVLTPCSTGWRAPIDSTVEMSRLAVETNYFPLWEAQQGKFRFTYRPKSQKPIAKFARSMGRFSHLTDHELEQFQAMVDARFKLIESLTEITEKDHGE